TIHPITRIEKTIQPITTHPITVHPITIHPITRIEKTIQPITTHPITVHPITIHPITRIEKTIQPITTHPITVHPITGIAKYINPVEKISINPIEKGPITIYSPVKTYSSVHQSNPSTISTGIGKYVRPMGGPTTINKKINIENPPSIGVGKYIRPLGGIANPNGEPKTVNRNSYSYEQEIEKINKPFMKKVSAITKTTQPQKTTTSSSSSFTIHRPGLPTFSQLKKQNPHLR
ncbi:MAG: hypothetical protein QXE05_07555, partial [Nitrososphaeria archaeon]